METIPRSTQCVQQHLHPAAQFFTDEELEVVSEAEWARSDTLLVAMEAERAQAERIAGQCHRCTTFCADLIGFGSEGLCGDCALYLVEVL